MWFHIESYMMDLCMHVRRRACHQKSIWYKQIKHFLHIGADPVLYHHCGHRRHGARCGHATCAHTGVTVHTMYIGRDQWYNVDTTDYTFWIVHHIHVPQLQSGPTHIEIRFLNTDCDGAFLIFAGKRFQYFAPSYLKECKPLLTVLTLHCSRAA